MTAESWASLIAALGVGAILPQIVTAIIKAISGRVGRERSAVEYERNRAAQAQEQADMLDGKLDDEIVKRRRAESKAAYYERLLVINGILPSVSGWVDEDTKPDRRKEEK